MPIHPDQSTKLKEKVAYARYLIDMDINGLFPYHILFINEEGVGVKQQVRYEWKPLKCSKCSKWGHMASECIGEQAKQAKQ